MPDIKTIFFWLGGVLTETITELTVRELVPEARGHEAVTFRKKIRGIAEEFSLGKLSPAQYCQQSISFCNTKIRPTDLENKILQSGKSRRPVGDLIEKIPEAYERWLICQYPKGWLDEISERLELYPLFQENRAVLTTELGLKKMVPDIFDALPNSAGRMMSECLVIDADSARAVEGTRHGLASIIYVYPERLKHELALQKILPTDNDVLHPTASERVSI